MVLSASGLGRGCRPKTFEHEAADRHAQQSWSTDTVRTREQFAYWHDAVSQAVLNVAPRNPGGGRFSGDITCSEFDDLRFAAFASTPHEIVRTPAHISRSKGEHYLSACSGAA